MKKIVFITILGVACSLSLSAQKESEIFYYCQGKKIYPKQKTDKIFLKFSPNAVKEQLLNIISSDVSLQVYDSHLKEGTKRSAVLETKDGKQIPKSTIDFFKSKEIVVSAEYLLHNNTEKFIAITDEFEVLLKETTSYEQLLELAEQHSCRVGVENQYSKNVFKLYVSKTSKFNVMQAANFFL